jgi:hypothetical protein
VIALALALAAALGAPPDVRATKHNLSASSGNAVRA